MSRLRWLTRRDALAGKFTIALTQGLALTPGLAGLMGAYMEPSCRGRSHSVGRNSGFYSIALWCRERTVGCNWFKPFTARCTTAKKARLWGCAFSSLKDTGSVLEGATCQAQPLHNSSPIQCRAQNLMMGLPPLERSRINVWLLLSWEFASDYKLQGRREAVSL